MPAAPLDAAPGVIGGALYAQGAAGCEGQRHGRFPRGFGRDKQTTCQTPKNRIRGPNGPALGGLSHSHTPSREALHNWLRGRIAALRGLGSGRSASPRLTSASPKLACAETALWLRPPLRGLTCATRMLAFAETLFWLRPLGFASLNLRRSDDSRDQSRPIATNGMHTTTCRGFRRSYPRRKRGG